MIEQTLAFVQKPLAEQMDIQIQENNKPKRTKLLKRINKFSLIMPQIKISHICNIEDSFFINQKSLRHPQEEEQSFLSSIFYFKTVSKVAVTADYITLHLKNKNQTYLPKQYFIQRFKSFGNRQFYQIAVHLEHIAKHLNQIKSLNLSEQQKQNFSVQKQKEVLNQSLLRLVGKRFFTFYYEFSQQGTCLNQIIISKSLLEALGYDVQKVALQFLNYRQAIFQIISAKLYFLVMQKKSHLLDTIFQKMKQQILEPQQVRAITMFRFNDELLKNSAHHQGNYEQKVKSRVKFSKSHPSVTIFQIQKMDRKSAILYQPKNKVKEQSLNSYKAMIRKQEIQSLKHLALVSKNLLQENVQKVCLYRQLNSMNLKE